MPSGTVWFSAVSERSASLIKSAASRRGSGYYQACLTLAMAIEWSEIAHSWSYVNYAQAYPAI